MELITSFNNVMTSPDGINWTSRTSAIDNGWHGITWTSRTAPVDNQWNGITWAPELGLFVAVSVTATNYTNQPL